VSAGIGVASMEHETLIIELKPAAASYIPCMPCNLRQSHLQGEKAQGETLPKSSYIKCVAALLEVVTAAANMNYRRRRRRRRLQALASQQV